MKKIIISCDNAADVPEEFLQKYDIRQFFFNINIGEKSYVDKLEISADEIYKSWWENKILPKTSAIVPYSYKVDFERWVAEGYSVIHFSIGSGVSLAHENAVTAAKEVGGDIAVIDTQTVSSTVSILVIKACKMRESGMSAEEIVAKSHENIKKANCTFVLDTLEFLKAGGRCSAVKLITANLFKIHPVIFVDNADCARMRPIDKYRGSMNMIATKYAQKRLATARNVDKEFVAVITTGNVEQAVIDTLSAQAKDFGFENVIVSRTSGVISSHAGPGAFGMLFLSDQT